MDKIEKEFLNFILNAQFPCIGAKVAANKKLLNIIVCNDMNSPQDDFFILSQIYQFIRTWQKKRELLQSFVVIFKNTCSLSEIEFEQTLWKRLQALHYLDSKFYSWDICVSSDVTDPNFSFSLGNKSFFIIGMHPNSSRLARQFTYPSLIFNLHEQFQILRQTGLFEKMRDKIRYRDVQLSGSSNPMICDFGDSSEALQYSGRITSKSYKCPFMIKNSEFERVNSDEQ